MNISRAQLLTTVVLTTLWAGLAPGVSTRTWDLDQPAQLLAGQMQDIAVTSRAELLLAPRVQRYQLDPKEADTVNVIAIGPEGLPYIGTGPNGVVYRVIDHVPRKFIDVPESQVFSLLFLDDGSLLVGTGGQRGAIHRVLPDGRTSVFWDAPNVRYVWALARDEGGTIYAATGTGGAIYQIAADGQRSRKLVSLEDTKNILALAMTGERTLAFGTDGQGLVGEVNTGDKGLRILFDAGERIVSAITPMRDGSLYVATTGSEAGRNAGRPPRRPQGRPENGDQEEDDSPADADGNLSNTLGSATLPFDRQGNADGTSVIYRIDPTGLSTRVLSLPVVFLDMAPADEDLVVGTGKPGRVYSVQPGRERYTALLRQDDAWFTAIARDGLAYWIGTSRPAAVVRVQPQYAPQGTYSTEALDAGQTAIWGQFSADLTLPAGTSVQMQSRSGQVRDVNGPGWSQWSQPVSLSADSEARITSPSARFLQVRLTLTASEGGQASPIVRSIHVPYLTRNMPPEISSLSITPADPAANADRQQGEWYAADPALSIEWKARDPNGDPLTFALHLRQVGNQRWIRIADDLSKSQYAWDSRSVPDGRYEIRLVASDSPGNPPATAMSRAWISEPFQVDNTAPRITGIRTKQIDANRFRVHARLVDGGTKLIGAQYTVNSASAWVTLLPTDKIFDSGKETLEWVVGPLDKGEHIVAIRAADARGNVGRAWLTLTVD